LTFTTQTDIIVGTTEGLFRVGAGDSNEDGGSGLSAPVSIVTDGNFCNLFVDQFVTETIYAFYNSATGVLSAFQETRGDSDDFELIFTTDILDRVPANAEHLLIDGFQDGFGLDALYNVFGNPEGGITVLRSTLGGSQFFKTYEFDMESPTDILVFESAGRERVIVVSPTSETAAYIPNANTDDFELINIGLGFDQVDYSEDAFSLTFSSSTQSNVIVRQLRPF